MHSQDMPLDVRLLMSSVVTLRALVRFHLPVQQHVLLLIVLRVRPTEALQAHGALYRGQGGLFLVRDGVQRMWGEARVQVHPLQHIKALGCVTK